MSKENRIRPKLMITIDPQMKKFLFRISKDKGIPVSRILENCVANVYPNEYKQFINDEMRSIQ